LVAFFTAVLAAAEVLLVAFFAVVGSAGVAFFDFTVGT
jgi:hypothetical protein